MWRCTGLCLHLINLQRAVRMSTSPNRCSPRLCLSSHVNGLHPHTSYSYLVYSIYNACTSYLPDTAPAVFTRAFCRDQQIKTTVHCTDRERLLSNSNQTLQFAWDRSEYNGGSDLRNYTIKYFLDGRKFLENLDKPTWSISDSTRVKPFAQLNVQVAAVNEAGVGSFSQLINYIPRKFDDQNNSNDEYMIVAISILGIILLIACVVLGLCAKHNYSKSRPRDMKTNQSEAIVPKHVASLPHISLKDVSITSKLGAGNFGKVFEGCVRNLTLANQKAQRVALKTLPSTLPALERQELLSEALTMRNMKHPNVVQLLGLCIEGNEMWIILELMDGGDLLSNLRSWRSIANMPSLASLTDLVRICRDVSQGCEYLTDLGYVHRDLAARNCLLSSNNPTKATVKIGDFGLTRGVYGKDAPVYQLKPDSKLPIRWSAPEVLERLTFEKASDVWAFGVTLWEVMTLGAEPYGNMSDNDVIRKVKAGYRLASPRFCPERVYELIEKCLQTEPCARPVFRELVTDLSSLYTSADNEADLPYTPAMDEICTFDASQFIGASLLPRNGQPEEQRELDLTAGIENAAFGAGGSGNQLLTSVL